MDINKFLTIVGNIQHKNPDHNFLLQVFNAKINKESVSQEQEDKFKALIIKYDEKYG